METKVYVVYNEKLPAIMVVEKDKIEIMEHKGWRAIALTSPMMAQLFTLLTDIKMTRKERGEFKGRPFKVDTIRYWWRVFLFEVHMIVCNGEQLDNTFHELANAYDTSTAVAQLMDNEKYNPHDYTSSNYFYGN